MNIIFVLIPLTLVLLAFAVWAFFWAVRARQFENLDVEAWRILMDDETPAGNHKHARRADAPTDQAEVVPSGKPGSKRR